MINVLFQLTADSVHEYVHKVGKDYGIDSSLLFDSLIISSDHCLTLFLPRPVVFFTDFTTVKDALITQGVQIPLFENKFLIQAIISPDDLSYRPRFICSR